MNYKSLIQSKSLRSLWVSGIALFSYRSSKLGFDGDYFDMLGAVAGIVACLILLRGTRPREQQTSRWPHALALLVLPGAIVFGQSELEPRHILFWLLASAPALALRYLARVWPDSDLVELTIGLSLALVSSLGVLLTIRELGIGVDDLTPATFAVLSAWAALGISSVREARSHSAKAPPC